METILGIILGAILGGAGKVVFAHYERIQERNGIAAALAGEISAVLNNADLKMMPAYFAGLAVQLRGPTPPLPPWIIIDLTYEPTPIAKAYIGRIGALGPKLAQRVAHWYSLYGAVLLETKILASGMHDADPLGAARRIDGGLALWARAEADAKDLIAALMALSGEQP
jgi:hypothetical protein